MKKLSFVLATLLVLVIFSCKKKESTPTASGTNTPVNPYMGNYYGVLYSNKTDVLSSGTLTTMGGLSSAYFSPNPFINTTTISEGFIGSAPDAGTITINTTTLKKTLSSGSYYFTDSTNTIFNSTSHTWVVSGSNGVPAINYTNTSVRPSYTGYSTLLDTIKIGQTNVINLNGITGADEIEINIFSGGMASRVLAGSATSVTFTPSDLSSLSATTSANISITCYKDAYQTFGGLQYKFKSGYALYKSIVVQ